MTDQVGIRAIATYLPAKTVDNLERGAAMGFDEPFLREKIGFLSMHEAEGETRCFDMACGALKALIEQTGIDPKQIDCLIVCTQNPDGSGLPNTASAIHGEMDLAQTCAAFDISLGCSGYVYGLSVIQSFMQTNALRCGVLVTADPYSKVIDANDRDTAPLFGDGATATLLEPGAPWQIGRSVFGSDGKRRAAIAVDDAGRLGMNGRGVFVFAAQTIPPLVQRTLDANAVALEDLDLILAHQGSRYIVKELRKRIGVDDDTLPFEASETGNMVSSSLPFMLASRLDDEACRILVTGFGVGLSWGATLLSKKSSKGSVS